jgi:hypothetical protein
MAEAVSKAFAFACDGWPQASGTDRLGMRSDGEDRAEPPARPFPGAHDMGSNHEADADALFALTP